MGPTPGLVEPPSSAPSPDDVDALDGVVRSIGDHARTVNLARAAGLGEALDDAAGGRLHDGRRRAAAELAHQLVGSAGTFGFAGVSDLAAQLERFFADGVYDATQLETARAQLGALFTQLQSDPDY
ncbi:MAG TPA: Hpt domain-containing protein [Propionibacteriaceae bacterium]